MTFKERDRYARPNTSVFLFFFRLIPNYEKIQYAVLYDVMNDSITILKKTWHDKFTLFYSLFKRQYIQRWHRQGEHYMG